MRTASYTIGAPAGKSGPATTRSQPNSTSVSYGTIGTDSTVDISNPTVTNGYVKVKILTSKNGTYAMGNAPNNEAYILADWAKGFTGGATPTNPPSGTPYLKADLVFIRSGAGTTFGSLARLGVNTQLRVIRDEEGGSVTYNGTTSKVWCYVQVTNFVGREDNWKDKYGYISALMIGNYTPSNPGTTPTVPPTTTHAQKYGAGFTGVVISDDGDVHIRKEPTSTSQSLLQVPQHHTVTYYRQGVNGNAAWIPVNKNGVDGWMASQYLRDGIVV